jgi:hypothetical protein
VKARRVEMEEVVRVSDVERAVVVECWREEGGCGGRKRDMV